MFYVFSCHCPLFSLCLGSSVDFSSSPLFFATLDFSPLPPSQAKKQHQKNQTFCPRLKLQLSSAETEISADYSTRKIEPSSARPFHVTRMYNLLVAVFSSYWLEIALAGLLLEVRRKMWHVYYSPDFADGFKFGQESAIYTTCSVLLIT